MSNDIVAATPMQAVVETLRHLNRKWQCFISIDLYDTTRLMHDMLQCKNPNSWTCTGTSSGRAIALGVVLLPFSFYIILPTAPVVPVAFEYFWFVSSYPCFFHAPVRELKAYIRKHVVMQLGESHLQTPLLRSHGSRKAMSCLTVSARFPSIEAPRSPRKRLIVASDTATLDSIRSL